MERNSTRLAVWLPDPLTVATWILKSLTTRRAPDETAASWTASSLGDMWSPSGANKRIAWGRCPLQTQTTLVRSARMRIGSGSGRRAHAANSSESRVGSIKNYIARWRRAPGRSGAERFFDLGADVGRALDDVNAGLGEGCHLLRRRPLATRDDRAGMPHP